MGGARAAALSRPDRRRRSGVARDARGSQGRARVPTTRAVSAGTEIATSLKPSPAELPQRLSGLPTGLEDHLRGVAMRIARARARVRCREGERALLSEASARPAAGRSRGHGAEALPTAAPTPAGERTRAGPGRRPVMPTNRSSIRGRPSTRPPQRPPMTPFAISRSKRSSGNGGSSRVRSSAEL
jgi:hypothetical protein